jgi:accessory gene regulator B
MTQKIAQWISAKTIAFGYDSVEEEILSYGYEIIILKLLTFAIILCVGSLLNAIWEAILFLAIFMHLRGFTGGLHVDSSLVCILSSVSLCTLAISAARFLPTQAISYIILPLLLSVIYIIRHSPINHPNLNLQEKEIDICKRLAKRYTLIDLAVVSLLYVLQVPIAIVVSGAFAIVFTAFLMIAAKIKVGG